MMKKKGKPAGLTIDFSGWHFDGWQEDISKLVKVHRDENGIKISIDLLSETFQATARKIATEAIREFVKEATFCLQTDGLWWMAEEMNQAVTVPWKLICLGEEGGGEAVRIWLAANDRPHDNEDH